MTLENENEFDSLKGSLDGITILDLSRILAGPIGTQLLGEWGARVIKLENPQGGDETRRWGEPYQESGSSAYYWSVNAFKESVAVDFSHKEGQNIIRDIIQKCHVDIVVENFVPGTLKKYNLSFEDLKKIKEDIIYVSLSGYSENSPKYFEPGYDLIVQGEAGIMSLTGTQSDGDGGAARVGVPIVDLSTGLLMSSKILAALRKRDKLNHQAQWIKLSLYDTAVRLLSCQGMEYLLQGNVGERLGSAHPLLVPYQLFQTEDSNLLIAVGSDLQFQRLIHNVFFDFQDELKQMGFEEERFSTNNLRIKRRDELIGFMEKILRQRSKSFWKEKLKKEKISFGDLRNLKEVFDDPMSFILMKNMKASRPPKLGENTQSILKNELKYSQEDIRSLQDKNFIKI
jgi:crotonobetainyl-CoA:carnitine CoA-transferase CaiB-like acyl-CoA transferase